MGQAGRATLAAALLSSFVDRCCSSISRSTAALWRAARAPRAAAAASRPCMPFTSAQNAQPAHCVLAHWLSA